MKNILVPTDLSVQSLHIIHEIVHKEQQQVNILLLHLVHPSNDITELLFQRKTHLYAQVPDNFTEALQVLKNKYLQRIGNLQLCFYYGSRTAIVNSIIESNHIDAVYLLSNHHYQLPFGASVNMLPLIKQCKLPVEMVYSKAKVFVKGQGDSLAALLVDQHGDMYVSAPAIQEAYN